MDLPSGLPIKAVVGFGLPSGLYGIDCGNLFANRPMPMEFVNELNKQERLNGAVASGFAIRSTHKGCGGLRPAIRPLWVNCGNPFASRPIKRIGKCGKQIASAKGLWRVYLPFGIPLKAVAGFGLPSGLYR